jgi:hypothetical protein
VNAQSPIGDDAASELAPMLPLAFHEHVELIKASRAVDAITRRRAGQMLTGRHTPESDLDKSIGHIVNQVRYRLGALAEIVGQQRMNLPPGRRGDCLKYIESAGATLIALWERVQVEVPED